MQVKGQMLSEFRDRSTCGYTQTTNIIIKLEKEKIMRKPLLGSCKYPTLLQQCRKIDR